MRKEDQKEATLTGENIKKANECIEKYVKNFNGTGKSMWDAVKEHEVKTGKKTGSWKQGKYGNKTKNVA